MQVRDEAPELLAVMLEKAMEGDVVALRFLLERGIPMTKAVAPNVEIPELTDAATLGDKARAILDAIARGDLPPDMGAQLVQAVGATARVVEVDELERRLAALEAQRETRD
jgi:hypothetical protein